MNIFELMHIYNHPKYFKLSIEHADDVNDNILTMRDGSGDNNTLTSVEMTDDDIDELIAGATLFATQLKILKG